MIVGEAPGRRELEIEKPFSGPVGKYLDKILINTGLVRDEIYITNSVRCHPPGDRTPTNQEVKACKKYLIDEISRVRPKKILALGSTALQSLVGKVGITEHRGHFANIEVDGLKIEVLPSFHPGFVARAPAMYPILYTDLLRFKGGLPLLMETHYEPVVTISRFKEVASYLLTCSEISWDLETDGLNAYDLNRGVICISISPKEGTSYVIPLDTSHAPWTSEEKATIYRLLGAILSNKKAWIVAFNGKFDLQWMWKRGIRARVDWDPHVASVLLDENLPHDLGTCVQLYLNPDFIKLDPKTIMSWPWEKVWPYAASDADWTLRLAHVMVPRLKADKTSQILFDNLMMPFQQSVLPKLELDGIWVNEEKMKLVEAKCIEEITEHKAKIREHVPEGYTPPVKSKKSLKKGFNPGSPKQLGDILYRVLGLPILGYTDGGEPSTAEAHLLELKNKHPIIPEILEFRKYDKYKSTFVDSWTAFKDPNGYIHPHYHLRPVTGRLSCLRQGTLIYSSRSVLPIEDVDRALEVITPHGERSVVDVFSGEKPLIRIEFSDGGLIECSTEHQFLDSKLQFTQAESLSIGDRVWVSIKPILGGEDISLEEYFEPHLRGLHIPITYPRVLNEKMAQFIGLFLAEGCFARSRAGEKFTRLKLGFNLDEKKIHQYVSNLVKELFNLEPYWEGKESTKSWGVDIRSQGLANAMHSILGRRYSHERKVPDFFFRAKPEIRAALLSGLFTGDGSTVTLREREVRGKTRLGIRGLTLTSSSKDLAYGTRTLLHGLGIFCRVKFRSPWGRRKRGVYKVRIPDYFIPKVSEKLKLIGEKADALLEVVKYVTDPKNMGREQSTSYTISETHLDYRKILDAWSLIPVKIESIKVLEGIHAVRDLTVEEPHCYIANGYVVHNCDEPNLQQTPRDVLIRNILGAPPGMMVIAGDYSQVEMRAATHYSQDPVLLAAYLAGEDIHLLTAMLITGLPKEQITKELRKKAKAINFGLIFGMGAEGLQEYAKEKYEVEMTLQEATQWRNAFFGRYAGLAPWHQRQIELVHKNHYVTSFIGRTRHLNNILSSDRVKVAEAERMSVNAPVQSLASDLTLMSTIQIDKIIKPTDGWLAGLVHDSAIYLIYENKVAYWKDKIKSIMENPPFHLFTKEKFTVPIIADVVVDKVWS